MPISPTTRLLGAIALTAGLLAVFSVPASCKAKSSKSKARSTTSKHRSRRSSKSSKTRKTSKAGKYLVPPPPPYAPSILPEIAHKRRSSTREETAEKPKSPYSKYIYTRAGYEVRAKKPNDYVTYWTTSN